MSKIKAIQLTGINSSSMGVTFKEIGDPLTVSCELIRIVNASDKDITISLDGDLPHDYVPASTTLELSLPEGSFAVGSSFYARGTAGTGIIYLSGYWTTL
jgi:hypothetical protein